MKAKLVGSCIGTHVTAEEERRKEQKLPPMTETERYDFEAGKLVDLAWDEFKRIATTRFPSGRCSIASFKSFRQEFGQWGSAVHRTGQLRWTGPTLGLKLFDDFIRMLEGKLGKGENGAQVEIKTQAKPEVKVETVRCGA